MSFKPELRDAISSGDLAEVRRRFESSDIDSEEYFGGSVLHYAAKRGSVEVISFLIERGADVGRTGGDFDAPPVTYAAAKGRLDVVQYLVEAGSPLDVRHALCNPLMRAANEGHVEVVKYLLTTDIDRQATYRRPGGALINALAIAEQDGHGDVVKLLKAHGCRKPVEGVDIPLWEPPDEVGAQTAEVQQYQHIIQYMEDRFGPADENGMQELIPVMDGMSVSINIIRPNEEHPFLVLFTNGMSDLPMKVPAGEEAWQYAELVIQLPADWLHPQAANSDPQWLWPVQWLRKMAYLPHLNETWLGRLAPIVSSDEPPTPLGPNTQQTCLMMYPDFSNLDPPLQRSDGSPIHFYTLVPLFTEERDYELKHGMDAFFERFIAAEVPMTVDVNRPNFALT